MHDKVSFLNQKYKRSLYLLFTKAEKCDNLQKNNEISEKLFK